MGKNIFTSEELKYIMNHKNRKLQTSLVENHLYDFSRKFQFCIPDWVSPDALTIVGHMPNILNLLFLVWISPSAQEEVPPVFALLYCYQLCHWMVFDCLDGIHARRTNQCSPWGPMLDSGFDQFSWAGMYTCFIIIFKLGNSPSLTFWLLFCICACAAYDGIKACKLGGYAPSTIDVTEYVIINSTLGILVYVFGDRFIYYEIPTFGSVQTLVAISYIGASSIYAAYYAGDTAISSKWRDRREGQLTRTAILNILILGVFGFYVTSLSSFKENHTLVFLSTLGCISHFSILTWNYQLCELIPTRKVGVMHELLIPCCLVFIDFVGLNFYPTLSILLYMSISWSVAIRFLWRVIYEIKQFSKLNVSKTSNGKINGARHCQE